MHRKFRASRAPPSARMYTKSFFLKICIVNCSYFLLSVYFIFHVLLFKGLKRNFIDSSCKDGMKSCTVHRGEEGQPHQSLVRTTFSSFSRPNHLKILVLSIIFFLSVRSLKIKHFLKVPFKHLSG